MIRNVVRQRETINKCFEVAKRESACKSLSRRICVRPKEPLLMSVGGSQHAGQISCTFPGSSRHMSLLPEFLDSDSSKRKAYAERRILGYTMEQMYDIVAEVEKYPAFVPACTSSEVFAKRPGSAKCKLEINFQVYKENYVSLLTLAKPNLVRSECTEGKLFNHLLTIWRFSPGPKSHPNTCTLDFQVSFEFRNALYSQVSGFFFDFVVKQMVSSFLIRAKDLHGPSSIPSQKPKILKYVT